jgi:hypothetical protein
MTLRDTERPHVSTPVRHPNGVLRIDDRDVAEVICPACGAAYQRVSGFVSDARGPSAVYFAVCHQDAGKAVWIDVILGTWGTSEPPTDHVNFSGLIRSDGVEVADAPVAGNPGGSMGGTALSREAAAIHPWAGHFQRVVDLVRRDDPSVLTYLTASDG